MVSQMFQNMKYESSAWFQRGRDGFFLSLLACSSGIDSFPESSVMLCSEYVCCALLVFFGHQPVPLGFLFFFYLKDSDILITVLFISISHLGSYGTCCPWLGATQSCCLFFWAGVLRALQKHTLHCSAVARYPDWDTWASLIQTYCSLPPSGDIMPLSLNLLCIAEGLLTPTRSSHICLCPWMGRREEGGKWIFGRRKWGCSKGLEATGRQFEAALETKRCSYAWSGT